jgi:uncharacterized protein (TIGR03437 family)
MLVAINGQNLSTSQTVAADYPWTTELAGSTVSFNGIPAALSYVSPTQINAVVPSALPISTFGNAGEEIPAPAAVVVTTANGASSPVTANVQYWSPAVFTQDTSGCGQASAFNVHADGTVSLNTPENSFDPASDRALTLFLTGLGPFTDRIDGIPWQFNPADNRAGGWYGFFSIPSLADYWPGIFFASSPAAVVTYAGPAPGLSGVDQVNLGVGLADAPEGCRVPLVIATQNGVTQFVNVSVHRAGGACSDSLADTLGLVSWHQIAVSDVGGPSSSYGVALQFLRGNGLKISERFSGPSGIGAISPTPVFCPDSYPVTLEAGSVTVSGNGIGSLSLQPQTRSSIVTYEGTLDSIPGGDYTITASGSAVGPFRSTVRIPPPVIITTNLQPGTVAPLTLNWTGGDTSSAVTVQSIRNSAVVFGSVLASAGTITLQPFTIHPGPGLAEPLTGEGRYSEQNKPPRAADSSPNAGDVEILVVQQPAVVPSFDAPGLTLGGRQAWKYIWHFRGLSAK